MNETMMPTENSMGCSLEDQAERQFHKPPPRRKLSCDDIAWLQDALERFERAVRRDEPAISRGVKAARMAALLEIMEVIGCEFKDDVARRNAIADFPELCPDRSVLNAQRS